MTEPLVPVSVSVDGVTGYARVIGQVPLDALDAQWIVTDLEGWESAPAPRTEREARVAGHGSYRRPVYRADRVITVEFTVTAPDDGTMRRIEDRAAALCSDPDRLYDLTVVDPALGIRTAQVELDGPVFVAPRDGRSDSSVVSVQLAAPDPRKYGPPITAQTGLPTGGTGGTDMTAPGTNMSVPGTDMGDAGTDGVAVVVVEGTAPTGAVLEITGPCQTPEVWAAELGTRVTWAGQVAVGQTLRINTGDFPAMGVPARTALLDTEVRDDVLTVLGGWSEVPAGSVTRWQFRSAAATAAVLTVHTRSAWW